MSGPLLDRIDIHIYVLAWSVARPIGWLENQGLCSWAFDDDVGDTFVFLRTLAGFFLLVGD